MKFIGKTTASELCMFYVCLLVAQLLVSLVLESSLVFALPVVSCTLRSKSKADYRFQQMEHGSSQTQQYSLWSAQLATHMHQPVKKTEIVKKQASTQLAYKYIKC
jgi:hypothetical protein